MPVCSFNGPRTALLTLSQVAVHLVQLRFYLSMCTVAYSIINPPDAFLIASGAHQHCEVR